MHTRTVHAPAEWSAQSRREPSQNATAVESRVGEPGPAKELTVAETNPPARVLEAPAVAATVGAREEAAGPDDDAGAVHDTSAEAKATTCMRVIAP
jgi:hypothetical protein